MAKALSKERVIEPDASQKRTGSWVTRPHHQQQAGWRRQSKSTVLESVGSFIYVWGLAGERCDLF